MTPVQQVIESLKQHPGDWKQNDCTLANKKLGIELWTANIPYLNAGIYIPLRKVSLLEKFRLQRAINEWHRQPIPLKADEGK